ncbi:MAG: hypothetical protein D6734_01185 [Candidatus Schekmanbacteria bacterium]|nr:MAG: hypothetical protein D6734_01185 [Candidatus Schekmanbacteria bacterium]
MIFAFYNQIVYQNEWQEIITDTTDTFVTETLVPFFYSESAYYEGNTLTATWTATMKSPSKMKSTVEIKNRLDELGGFGTYTILSLSANVGEKIPIQLTIDGTYNFEKGTEWSYDGTYYASDDIIMVTITNILFRLSLPYDD